MKVVDLNGESLIIDELEKKYTHVKDLKKVQDLDVLLNMKYLQGDTYRGYDGVHRVIREYDAFTKGVGIEKENYNIFSRVRGEYVSRLTRTFPKVRCKPETQDYNTKTKALITNKILDFFERTVKMPERYREFCNHIVDTGTCGFAVYWNNQVGELADVKFHKSVNEKGEPIQEVQVTRSGDIGIDLVYYWEVFPDTLSRVNLEDCAYFFRARVQTVKSIEDVYGKEVIGENTSEFNQPTSTENSLSNTYRLKEDEEVILKEYYERPTPTYPSGRYIVYANRTLLYAGTLPYPLGEYNQYVYPIVMGKFSSLSASFFGDTVLSATRSVQRNVDSTENMKRRILAKQAYDKWFYEEGSLDYPDDLQIGGNDLIPIKFGRQAPQQATVQGIGNDVFMHGDNVMNLNSMVSGVSRFNLSGNTNSAQRSGEVLSQMNNRDSTSFSSTITNIETLFLNTYKLVLNMYKVFVPNKKWKDKFNKHYNMINFKYDEVLEDLTLTNKGLIGLTDDEERQMLSQLAQFGLFNRDEQSTMDVPTKQHFLNQLKLGSLTDFIEDPFIEQMYAQEREYEDLVLGEKVDINPYDDHKAHLLQMEKIFNSPDFYEMRKSENGKTIYKSCIEHYNKHKEALDNEMKQQVAEQMMLQQKQG